MFVDGLLVVDVPWGCCCPSLLEELPAALRWLSGFVGLKITISPTGERRCRPRKHLLMGPELPSKCDRNQAEVRAYQRVRVCVLAYHVSHQLEPATAGAT
eukprot:1493806-Pyramimonas_sp.AAC.1